MFEVKDIFGTSYGTFNTVADAQDKILSLEVELDMEDVFYWTRK